MDTVTIAIPVYNVEQYIRQAIESALAQTCKGCRIMIVDDCGGDRSMEIAENVIKEHRAYRKVQIIRHDRNKGLGAARNTAIYNCDTDYLYFLDSDDYLQPDAIENLLKAAKKNDADITIGGIRQQDDPGGWTRTYCAYPDLALKTAAAGIYLTAYPLTNINTEAWGKLYKTSLFNDNNIQCAHPILEDVMLWMQTAYYAQSVATIPQTVQTYRRRTGSICRSPWATPQRQSLLRQIRADLAAFAHSHPAKGMRRTLQRMQQILSALTAPSTHAAPTAPSKNDISSP